MGKGLHFGVVEMFWNHTAIVVGYPVNILNASELFTLKHLT